MAVVAVVADLAVVLLEVRVVEEPAIQRAARLAPQTQEVAVEAATAAMTDMVQAGVPAIGAILRGMDLVFFGNFSGNATKLGSDATLALIANGGSGIVIVRVRTN